MRVALTVLRENDSGEAVTLVGELVLSQIWRHSGDRLDRNRSLVNISSSGGVGDPGGIAIPISSCSSRIKISHKPGFPDELG